MSFNLVRRFPHVVKSMLPRVIFGQRKYTQCHQCLQQMNSLQLIGNKFTLNLLYAPTRYTVISRTYAKGKDKKKDKGKVKIDESILSNVINVEKLRDQYEHCIESLKEDYAKNLSLRSTTGSIETLSVKFEGNEYTLQELAQIVRQNPKSIILNMASFPQAIPVVLQAIEKSGMNLNPQQDGTKVFIPVPKVTKELRVSLSKNAKAMFIKCRTNLKDVQNKIIKNIKNKEKSENLPTDTSRMAADQVTAICDQYIFQADKIFLSKQTELLGESN